MRKTKWQLSKINAFIALCLYECQKKVGRSTEECGGMGTSDHRPVYFWWDAMCVMGVYHELNVIMDFCVWFGKACV